MVRKMGALEQSIKEYAEELGLDIVDLTTADPFPRDEQAALERIRDGLMDGLPWYTEERVRRATHPETLLPGARSVISLAISYLTGEAAPNGDGPQGKIARYAWGDAYHNVIKTPVITRNPEEESGLGVTSKIHARPGLQKQDCAPAF